MRLLTVLETSPLLRDLSAAQINAFAQLLATQTFASGDYILQAGTNSEKIFIVQSGLACVRLPGAASPKSALHCAALLAVEEPGAVLGEINLLNKQGHSAHIVAVGETACWWVSSECFERFCNENHVVWRNIARIATLRLQRNNERVALLSTRDAGRIVASILLDFSASCSDLPPRATSRLSCVLTQDEIALMSGLCRRTVNTIIVNLERREIIRLLPGRHPIVITDVGKLRSIRQGKTLC